MSDFFRTLLADAVDSMAPRPGYAAELLAALRGTPSPPVWFEDEGKRFPRWILPGTFAGAVGAAGVVFYGVSRRHRGKAGRRRT